MERSWRRESSVCEVWNISLLTSLRDVERDVFREGSTFRTLDGILGAKQRRLLVKERQLVSGHYSQSARKAWELQARSCKLQVCKQSSEYC